MPVKTMPELPIGELKKCARGALDDALAQVRRETDFTPFFRIIHAPGRVTAGQLPGPAMENGTLKELLFGSLGQLCRESGAPGLIIAIDAWTLTFSDAQNARLNEDAYFAAFQKMLREQGTAEAAAAGFGTLAEVISITAQTERDAYTLAQTYQRVCPDGSLIPASAVAGAGEGRLPEHSIRLTGEPRVLSSEDGWEPEGRLFSLYRPGKS